MKKTIAIAVFIIALLQVKAQKVTDFDKFEDYDNVTTVVVNKKAFSMLKKISEDNEEGKEFNEMVGGLEELKVFATDDVKVAQEMKKVFEQHKKSAGLEELMRVKDEGRLVKIYVKDGADEDHVSEFLMMEDGLSDKVQGDKEFVIVSITGDIDLNKISSLTSHMDIPGGEHLRDIHHKK